MNTLIDTFRSLGPARLALMVGVTATILAFFIYFAGRVAQPEMELLYADLDPADSSQIVSQLEAQGVAYRLNSNGSRIMVPGDQVARVRLSMAEHGLPSGGSLGYEIFDRSEGLGTSNFVQNVNHLRALEGELARTIRSLSAVQTARVHLVLPQRELFSRERNQPSASIVLGLGGNRLLDPHQVRAIQTLVAAGVPEMSPEMVAIIDDRGNLLARTSRGDQGPMGLADTVEERRIALENRLARAAEELLERSVGIGNVRVEVVAELDFDRVTENAEIYDPDGQVVRSTQFVEENAQEIDAAEPGVTVAGNLPDANLPPVGGGAGGPSSVTSRTEETTNYEISRTLKTHVRESGAIRRLSVAVLVNGKNEIAENGETVYQERSDEELERLAALARSAVGFDPRRGDSFEIANLRFASIAQSYGLDAGNDGELFGIDRHDIMRVVELLVLGVVAVLVLLLVVKPLVGRLLDRNDTDEASSALLGRSGAERPALAGPHGDAAAQHLLSGPASKESGAGHLAVTGQHGGLPAELTDSSAGPGEMIDMQQVEGRVRASSIKKISEIVERHPEEAVGIVRNWLYQES